MVYLQVKVSPLDNPGQHPRELNPYWKDGGCGMPEAKTSQEKRSTRTGDGGRSWILRSYKRAIEQAENEGKELNEIAIKRWGSLDKLHSLLRAAGIDPNDPDKKPHSKQREYLYSEPIRSRGQLPKRHSSVKDDHDRKDSKGRHHHAHSSSFLMPEEMQPSSSDNSVRTHHTLTKHIQDATNSRNWQTLSEKRSREEPLIRISASSSLTSGDTKDSGNVQLPSTRDRLLHTVTDPKVTDSQLNSLSAKVMKAEMLGDESKASVLKAKLEKLRELKKVQDEQTSQSTKTEATNTPSETIIPLVTTDRFGRTRPLDKHTNGSSRKRQSSNDPHSRKGKRKKYSSDDESYSLQALVEQERKMSAKDTQLAIASMASKFVSSTSQDDTIDEKHASKVAVSLDARQNEEREKMKAMHESRKLAEHLENCKLCFGNDNFSKNLLIAVGINVYLAAPSSQSLTDGHCLLVPMEHSASMMLVDENVWEEVKVFQKGLTRMFDARGLDVIFTESYMSASNKYHAYIDCIPLPKEEGSLAPMYFKKAILESDEEWSLNRKLISTKEKGVRQSLPIGLPYFFVEFGLEGGFGHIIEDQSLFPAYFAKEVVGGMLDVEPRLWLKPPRDNFESQKRKVLKLSEWWKPYDWTQKIKSQ